MQPNVVAEVEEAQPGGAIVQLSQVVEVKKKPIFVEVYVFGRRRQRWLAALFGVKNEKVAFPIRIPIKALQDRDTKPVRGVIPERGSKHPFAGVWVTIMGTKIVEGNGDILPL